MPTVCWGDRRMNHKLEKSVANVRTQTYVIKSEGSIAKTFNKILQKLSAPLKPRVPEHSNNRMKNLSYPFSREKMYL
ncbi:hypothetical protein J1605_020967 [Eschrichtius robustus]|uniref:Uncharacterized protein n=1 Tax=Eschrichtius robustus TaxID=9764 RepID=A0AB34HI33_ESCRO|nr:hypothetical protein J1605_020967 [Eschrichtius robustus]